MNKLKFVLAALFFLASFTPSLAVDPEEKLSDPVLEERAREISKGLRCLVCQNQSIDDSNAGLAKDLRVLVRERLLAGDTNAEARDYIVARYGDFVLLKPPVKPETYALWITPPLALILALIAALRWYRNRPQPMPEALSAEEQAASDEILKKLEK
jgi:cytochrome c-type biogenesis protein CcmH